MRRILLTGAAGSLGSMLRHSLPRGGEIYRFSDIRPFACEAEDDVRIGDLADLDFAMDVTRDVDAIVHMAGNAKESPWDKLIGPNIIAVTNLWEAARANGVRRIVFGSSNHVLGMYPTDLQLDETTPLRPDSRYGATKVFAEAVASLYADKYGIKSLLVRIGTYAERPPDMRALSTWISPRDLTALIRTGLEADYHCDIVFGVSRNSAGWCDNARAFALGYQPRDNAEDYRAEIDPSAVPGGPVGAAMQGGGSAAKEFSGDLEMLRQRGRR